MPRKQFTGTGKLYWVPDTGDGSAVSLSAPTVTQVSAGIDITPFLRRDGLSRPASGNLVDTSDASSRFNSTDLGTFGGDKLTVKLYRDSTEADDTAWPLFAPGLRGFLVPFDFGLAGAIPAVGDRCQIYQSAVNTRVLADIAENQANYFTTELAVVAPPNDDATLVAGA